MYVYIYIYIRLYNYITMFCQAIIMCKHQEPFGILDACLSDKSKTTEIQPSTDSVARHGFKTLLTEFAGGESVQT